MNLKGLGVAVITPFDDDNRVDFTALSNILNHLVNNKVDYLVMLGTTSEAATLTHEEKDKVVQTALEVNQSRLPIVLGVGGNNTQSLVDTLLHHDFSGIDAILSVCPYYNKPNQEGIYQHFETLAKNSPKPIILYNVPGRTAANMNAATTLRLAHDFENIIGIKEASADFDQIMEIVKNKPQGFQVVSGDDALTLPLLSLGLEGVISVIGNAYPSEFATMIEEFFKGNTQQARQFHYKLIDLIHVIFAEGNPVGIKALMTQLGFCQPHVRLPLVSLSRKNTDKLKELLSRV